MGTNITRNSAPTGVNISRNKNASLKWEDADITWDDSFPQTWDNALPRDNADRNSAPTGTNLTRN